MHSHFFPWTIIAKKFLKEEYKEWWIASNPQYNRVMNILFHVCKDLVWIGEHLFKEKLFCAEKDSAQAPGGRNNLWPGFSRHILFFSSWKFCLGGIQQLFTFSSGSLAACTALPTYGGILQVSTQMYRPSAHVHLRTWTYVSVSHI